MFNSLKIDAENFIRSTMSMNSDHSQEQHLNQYFYQENLFDDSDSDDDVIEAMRSEIIQIKPLFSQRNRMLGKIKEE